MKDISADKYFVIITYDIVDDRMRNRILKKMKGMGFHVQKSVFECFLDDDRIERLKQILLSEIDEEIDSIRIYKLKEKNITNIEILGVGELTEDRQLTIL